MLKESPVDRGILRNAWKVVRHPDGAELVNDQPYAGILERGSRPFKISKEGLIALAGWVKRKILAGNYSNAASDMFRRGTGAQSGTGIRLNHKEAASFYKSQRKKGFADRKLTVWALDEEATSIAYAIAKSWQKNGRKGKYFVLRNLPKLAKLMDDEISRSLSKFFNRP